MFAIKFTLTIILLYFVGKGHAYRQNEEPRKFPKHLLFGASTSANQIEGAWNEDGRTESFWDHLSHRKPCFVQNCDTTFVSAKSYRYYKKDVKMIRDLGLDFYRFSISWSRILPTSFPDVINQAGVDYYNNLIDELLKYNITPMVTMSHFDIPQKLQDMGGWYNPHIVDWFTDYAKILFELFGDRVKIWFTINEPREFCNQVSKIMKTAGASEYICAKNSLLAHAKAYHLYDKEYRHKQNGQVSIVLNTYWFEPETEDDIEAAENMIQFDLGLYAHPIFSNAGGWPSAVKNNVNANSVAQGFERSRLPDLTAEEIKLIKGTADFFAINHYTTAIVRRNVTFDKTPSYLNDAGAMYYQPEDWEGSAASWLKVVPWGFTKLLNKIREEYGNPPVYVTENGFPLATKGLQDVKRISYLRQYLSAMLDSIDEGSNVTAYSVWSLMDNFEWIVGYHDKFGLYEVDFDSPEKTRTPRLSAYYYKEIIKSRMLDMSYEPPASAVNHPL